ncbi:Crp/Fnr family transcriptional regulator [Chitinophaga sp. HK235]|uniref:Crp/Fnr family transcriptional regulator n=1 Tax=Chitinophaga sp. HK235 TaxID=2952571 RepID=UPI001BACF7FB|nr:Crp/Fnr family transcriptional regulator [Chitinophaga sp. HK235]
MSVHPGNNNTSLVTADKRDQLRTYIESYSPLRETTWKRVQSLFVLQTLEKNDFFTREGEPAKNIAFLEKGVVRAFYSKDNGEEYNKMLFTAPSLIGGYASLITGKKALVSQQALTACTIRIADFRQLAALYDTCHDLERFSRKWAEALFVEKEEREIELVSLNATQRYINFRKAFAEVEQLVPQYHIASYLGVSATQLSRIRRKMTGG